MVLVSYGREIFFLDVSFAFICVSLCNYLYTKDGNANPIAVYCSFFDSNLWMSLCFLWNVLDVSFVFICVSLCNHLYTKDGNANPIALYCSFFDSNLWMSMFFFVKCLMTFHIGNVRLFGYLAIPVALFPCMQICLYVCSISDLTIMKTDCAQSVCIFCCVLDKGRQGRVNLEGLWVS